MARPKPVNERKCKRAWLGYSGIGTLAGLALGFGIGKAQKKSTSEALLQGVGAGLAAGIFLYVSGTAVKCAVVI